MGYLILRHCAHKECIERTVPQLLPLTASGHSATLNVRCTRYTLGELMNILGLNIRGHDTGAALISQGRLTAIGEERLDRRKHSRFFPHLSVKYLLDAAGLKSIDDIDLLVGVTHYHKDGSNATINAVRSQLAYKGKVHTISHHDAHAASAYYASPFDEAAVMVVDGLGSNADEVEAGKEIPFAFRGLTRKQLKNFEEVQSFYRGLGNAMTSIRKNYTAPGYMNGIGLVYMGTSVFLNFGDFGSGKVMGLAPYGGQPGKIIDEPFVEVVDGAALSKGEKAFFRHLDLYQKRYFPAIRPRDKEILPDDLYTEIAWAVQDATEKTLITIAEYLYRVSPCKNLCYAGGVALNSVANKKILDNTPFDNIFVQPGACDSGIALGCALFGAHVISKEELGKYRMRNAYLGKTYSDEEIVADLRATSNIGYTKEKDITKKAAGLLAQGKILGWFEGGSEIGPRALGHRSIICDPSKPEMKDILNAKVKHREGFRPFAPAVLLEKAFEYFDLICESPYMLLIAEVKKENRHLVPAITHVDGTARVQTVTKEDNGRYYDLVKEFEAITGIPVILNTSYNIAGEPIVEKPLDALRCFMSTEIDYLVIEDYLIEATGPKNLARGPVVDENKLKAIDIPERKGFRKLFSGFKNKA
jgi:carbamoyltransferase